MQTTADSLRRPWLKNIGAFIQRPDSAIASGKQDWEKPLFRDIGRAENRQNSGYEITSKIENLLIYSIGVFYSDFPTVAVAEENTPIKIDGAENKLLPIVFDSALTNKINSHSAEPFMCENTEGVFANRNGSARTTEG